MTKDKADSSRGASQHRGIAASQPRRFSLFPKPLSFPLAQLVKPVYKKHGFAEHRILTEWPLIVGEELARCSVPQKLASGRDGKGGALHIRVASSRALELQHLQPVILDKIAAYFGYAAVSRLVLAQSLSLTPSAKKKAGQEPRPEKVNSYADAAASCEDESLRKALQSLAGAMAAVEN